MRSARCCASASAPSASTRIWLTVDADNARAIRSYEKVGFRREGVMRQSRRGLNGLADSLLMAILRDEWEAAQAVAG